MSAAETARKFHFLREIASGGFGRVYLAKIVHNDGFSRLCAVKMLHPKWSENEEIASRMRDEARLLGMLRHKNIVDVLDLTRIDSRAAVIMEYLEAVDLKVLVSHSLKKGGRVPLRVALQACAGVASALDAAYNRPPYAGEKPLRVVHRDIKPSNIMVDANGLPKVLDFGVARAEFDTREARTQELSFGSVEYMSPERLFFEPESSASDIYSLGATLYEILALDKLGKARLRAEEHEKWVAERFEDLLESHPQQSEETEDLLHDLLYDMLAFDESSRPSAGDCVMRMRAFSRSLSTETLEEWAEREIPPLVAIYQAKPQRHRDGDSTSLVDRVLVEDSEAFPVEVEETPADVPVVAVSDARETEVAPAQDATEEPPEPPRAANPERWQALKKATLASLAGEGDDGHSAAWDPGTVPAIRPGPPPVPDGIQSIELTEAPPTEVLPTGRISTPHEVTLPEGLGVMPEGFVAEFDDTPPTVQARVAGPNGEIEIDALMLGKGESKRAPEVEPIIAPLAKTDEEKKPAESTENSDLLAAPIGRAAADAAPPSGGGWGRMGLLVVLGLVFLAVGGGVLLVGAGAAVLAARQYSGAESSMGVVPSDATENPAEAPVDAPSEPEAPAGGGESEEPDLAQPVNGARFVSHLDGTRKISVRCDGGTADGTDVAVVDSDPLGTCTVIALGANRKRLTTVVRDVERRDYACFEGGDKTCE